LDYDGTLTPLAGTPSEARLAIEMRELFCLVGTPGPQETGEAAANAPTPKQWRLDAFGGSRYCAISPRRR
jgi:hypothetical protein